MRVAVAIITACALGACTVDAYDIGLAMRDAARDAAGDAAEVDAGDVAPLASCAAPSPPGCGRVRLAGGAIVLGSADAWDSGADAPGRAMPLQRHITVSAFALDRYEVTVGRFRRFVEAKGAPRGIWTRGADDLSVDCNWTPDAGDREAHPMNCVDWDAAGAFCAWDAAEGRLPTEAELELAARGTAGRAWPWGGTGRAPPSWVCWNRALPAKLGTCAVDDPDGARGQSPEGVWHLVGNVAEWSGDLYARYDNALCWGDRPRVDPRCEAGAENSAAVRTGSWFDSDLTRMVPGARWSASRLYRHASLGFRCAAPR